MKRIDLSISNGGNKKLATPPALTFKIVPPRAISKRIVFDYIISKSWYKQLINSEIKNLQQETR